MNMTRNVRNAINQAFEYIYQSRPAWQLEGKHVWLEVSNHVLRVLIQMDMAPAFKNEFYALLNLQKEDGGWGEYTDSKESSIRVSAFAGQMLLRANMIFKTDEFTSSVCDCISFLLNNQKKDGSWQDKRWHRFDATSVPTGTLLFAVNNGYSTCGEYSAADLKQALKNSMHFIETAQNEEGLWIVKQKGVATIESTAHLLQKCITYGCSMELLNRGINALLLEQHEEGFWAGGNVDATCDVSRCLLYFNSMFTFNPYFSKIEKAVANSINWLLDISVEGTLGDRPGSRPNVLVTCDFIDTACKYLLYIEQKSKMRALYS
jgi:hypothetical protein